MAFGTQEYQLESYKMTNRIRETIKKCTLFWLKNLKNTKLMCVWWFILNYEICMKFEVSQSDTMQWSLICRSISWIYRYYLCQIYNYNRRIHPKINSIQEWYQENLRRIHVYFYLEFECNQLSQFILFLDSSFTNKSSVYVVYYEIVSMSNIKLSVNLPLYLLRCLLTGKFIIDSLNLLNFDACPPSRNCALSCHCH